MDIVVILDYFVIYSFFGWILESVYKTIHEKKFINSGFLAGPFCPIYGYGALIMYLFLDRFADSYLLLYASAFVILSLWEYIVGLFLEIVFHTKYWDYSCRKFNIHGRVCLFNSIFWGILGIIFIKLIHPGVDGLLNLVPDAYVVVFTVVSIGYILIDTVITTVKLIRVNIKLSNIEEINSKIQKLLPDLDKYKLRPVNKTTVLRGIVKIKRRNKQAVYELSQRRQELIDKINKQTSRIRRAFPSMKYERMFKYIRGPRMQLPVQVRSVDKDGENTEEMKKE